MNNKDEFKTRMIGLFDLFDKDLSAAVLKMYWAAFQSLTDDEVFCAMDQAVITCKFMPKPAEIIDLIRGDSKSQALGEWGKVLGFMRKEGRFGEHKLPADILDAVNQIGGWEYLCTLTYKQLEFKARAFTEIYEGKSAQGLISNDQLRIH